MFWSDSYEFDTHPSYKTDIRSQCTERLCTAASILVYWAMMLVAGLTGMPPLLGVVSTVSHFVYLRDLSNNVQVVV